MDLILWRHAEAEDRRADLPEMERALTAKGEKQATRMGAWLDRRLPENARILSSPALRCQQTAQGLGRKFKLRGELAPDGDVQQLLEAAQWPQARHTVVLVVHQPTGGDAVAHLLGMAGAGCAVRKGALWWLRSDEDAPGEPPAVVAVLPPDLA